MAAPGAPTAALSTHDSASWCAVEQLRFPVHRSVQFSLLRSSELPHNTWRFLVFIDAADVLVSRS